MVARTARPWRDLGDRAGALPSARRACRASDQRRLRRRLRGRSGGARPQRAGGRHTGIAGLSIEDSTGDPARPLYDFTLAVERIQAARRAIDEDGSGLLLTGRSEGFIAGKPDLQETIRRLTAYAEAGADCLFAPGIRTADEIRAVVTAVAPKPVNVLVASDFTTVLALAELGVRRISVGGALARAAWTGFLAAAREIQDQGTFASFGRATPGLDINRILSPR